MSRHFLYLTNTRMVSLLTKGAHIAARREFAVSGAGVMEFDRYASTVAGTRTHLFTDLTEEDFRLDTIPHVGRSDRDVLLARKMAQMFRNTPYRHAFLQGREPEGRRDDRVLYTAITNAEVLKPWLDVIERHRVPLDGIYSSAVFSGVLLEELDLVFPHTLLVTFTPGNAMRQTYFRDREIKFSRITPVDLEEGQTLGALVAEETGRTWQYLDSLRHFAQDDRLEVCVLVHPRDRPAVEPALRDYAQIQYRQLDMEQVATKLGLKPAPLDSTAEEVIIHLYVLRKGENHYASQEVRRHATVQKARALIGQLSMGVLAASIVWGGWNLSRVFETSEADRRVAQELQSVNREYEEVSRALPSFGIGGSTMRDTVVFYNGWIRAFPSVGDFLTPLSNVLGTHPDVKLAQVSWVTADDPKTMPRMVSTPARISPPVKALTRVDPLASAGAADEGLNPSFPTARYEIALVEATVRVPVNDFRGAIDEVDRLAADISRLKGFRADVVESPLDTNSSITLQAKQGEKESPTMEPRFVLRIVRERSPA